jgi:hypothetical protein
LRVSNDFKLSTTLKTWFPHKKYTVRVFEILYSMILGQAYNIYRHFHSNTRRELSHTEFKIAVIKGFLNHHVVRAAAVGTVLPIHKLRQFPPGSYGDGTQKRKRLSCRECPNLGESGDRNCNRTTNWYCNQCNTAFHPDCFHAYHKVHSPNYVPKKRARPQFEEIANMAEV